MKVHLILLAILSTFFVGCINSVKKSQLNNLLIEGNYHIYNGKDSVSLGDVLSTNRSGIIYLTNLGCSPCAEKELAILNSLPPDIPIIVVGKFSSNRDFRIFAQRCRFSVFRIKSSNRLFQTEKLRHNYSIIIDPELPPEIIDISEQPLESTQIYRELLRD